MKENIVINLHPFSFLFFSLITLSECRKLYKKRVMEDEERITNQYSVMDEVRVVIVGERDTGKKVKTKEVAVVVCV